MTSVEDAVSLVGVGTPPVRPMAAPSVPSTRARAVSPRATPTLERRRQWERLYRVRLRLTDAAVILAAVSASAAVSLGAVPIMPAASTGRGLTVAIGAALAGLWFLMLAAARTRAATIFGSGATEYKRVVHAGAIAFGVLATGAVFADPSVLRVPLLVAMPLGTIGLLAGRWGWRRWLSAQRRHGRYASRTLVVGDRAEVEYVVHTLQTGAVTGYNVVGATLLDGNARAITVGDVSRPVLGNVTSVAQVAQQLGADTILVASRPEGDPEFIKRLSWQLEGTAAELVLSSRLTDVAGPRISFAPVEGLPLIQVRIPSYEGGQHLAKRALDVVVAALALIPIAIVTPLLALLIRLDSPGPVFFRQERVGRDGRTFRMVKFRSMSVDAEDRLADLQAQNEGSGLLFKIRADPRVTRVGKWLRKLSLDELPQFWNVLVGDMSVVGPRPPLPSEVTAYDGTVSRRLYIKPGITGLWQVSGRSDLTWDESVRLDLRYVENWSIMNDLQIMWRTARVMLQPHGAY